MSLDAPAPPLTRREALAREAAIAAADDEPEATLPEIPTALSPTPRATVEALVEAVAEAVVRFRRRAALATKRLARRRASGRVGRVVRAAHTSPRRQSSIAAKFVSLASLIVAGALLVGSSLPVNVLAASSSASAAPDVRPEVRSSQSLQVSSITPEVLPVRDNFEVVSYAQILAARFVGVDYSYSVTTGIIRWPLSTAIPITDGFGPRASGFHKGVDFVPGVGTPIYAIADGVAVSSGSDDSGYGNHVVIQHYIGGVNVKSNYAHMILDSSPIVAGQHINVGDFLGLVGDTGISYGAHLHFEIYIDDVPVDPFKWLQANASNS